MHGLMDPVFKYERIIVYFPYTAGSVFGEIIFWCNLIMLIDLS